MLSHFTREYARPSQRRRRVDVCDALLEDLSCIIYESYSTWKLITHNLKPASLPRKTKYTLSYTSCSFQQNALIMQTKQKSPMLPMKRLCANPAVITHIQEEENIFTRRSRTLASDASALKQRIPPDEK